MSNDEQERLAALRAQHEQESKAAQDAKLAAMTAGMEQVALAMAAYRDSLLAQGFTRNEAIQMAVAMQSELAKLAGNQR